MAKGHKNCEQTFCEQTGVSYHRGVICWGRNPLLLPPLLKQNAESVPVAGVKTQEKAENLKKVDIAARMSLVGFCFNFSEALVFQVLDLRPKDPE